MKSKTIKNSNYNYNGNNYNNGNYNYNGNNYNNSNYNNNSVDDYFNNGNKSNKKSIIKILRLDKIVHKLGEYENQIFKVIVVLLIIAIAIVGVYILLNKFDVINTIKDSINKIGE